eukprot:TRINITY_DN19493_c0_g1_i1.p1 TRINITY_DN19493_c0_g1~~TRINITY_DN19493_c0_g1_i1.p1  ORF type:complete len:556 (+),score=161.18 TRINITY_DN19493_c0_g1_i1:85-1668(+)
MESVPVSPRSLHFVTPHETLIRAFPDVYVCAVVDKLHQSSRAEKRRRQILCVNPRVMTLSDENGAVNRAYHLHDIASIHTQLRPPPPSLRLGSFVEPRQIRIVKKSGEQVGANLEDGMEMVEVQEGSAGSRQGLEELIGRRLVAVNGVDVDDVREAQQMILPQDDVTLNFQGLEETVVHVVIKPEARQPDLVFAFATNDNRGRPRSSSEVVRRIRGACRRHAEDVPIVHSPASCDMREGSRRGRKRRPESLLRDRVPTRINDEYYEQQPPLHPPDDDVGRQLGGEEGYGEHAEAEGDVADAPHANDGPGVQGTPAAQDAPTGPAPTVATGTSAALRRPQGGVRSVHTPQPTGLYPGPRHRNSYCSSTSDVSTHWGPFAEVSQWGPSLELCLAESAARKGTQRGVQTPPPSCAGPPPGARQIRSPAPPLQPAAVPHQLPTGPVWTDAAVEEEEEDAAAQEPEPEPSLEEAVAAALEIVARRRKRTAARTAKQQQGRAVLSPRRRPPGSTLHFDAAASGRKETTRGFSR